jgi:hypothetical protein
MKHASQGVGRRFSQLFRELEVRVSSYWAGRGCTVMVFPGGGKGGTSAGLRGWSLAPQLRKLGFRVIVIPSQLQLKQRQRLVARECPDFILLQKCRDPLNDPAFFPQTPCILDMDDADFLNPSETERIIRITGLCIAAVGGSAFVEAWLAQYCPITRVIWTGSPLARLSNQVRIEAKSRTLVYAVSDILGFPRETTFVRDIAVACGRGSGIRLHLIGRGDRDAILEFFAPVIQAGIPVELTGWLPYRNLIERIREGVIGLAPLDTEGSMASKGKSFGKVLAYLAAGVPVLCSDAAEYPLFFRSGVNGYVLPNDHAIWRQTILGLLDDSALQEKIVKEANRDFHDRLSATSMARQWSMLLSEIQAKRGVLR